MRTTTLTRFRPAEAVALAPWAADGGGRLPNGSEICSGGTRLTCPVRHPRVSATMTDGDLERFLVRIALPSVRLGLYVKRLQARSADPAARVVVIDELRRAARIRVRLARAGWWN